MPNRRRKIFKEIKNDNDKNHSAKEWFFIGRSRTLIQKSVPCHQIKIEGQSCSGKTGRKYTRVNNVEGVYL